MVMFAASWLLVIVLPALSRAAPTKQDVLDGFPILQTAPNHNSFKSIDLDGVYRTWLADGTVLDAARLNMDQIATYLEAIQHSPISAAELASTESQLRSADSSSVSDEELFDPAEAIKPVGKLAAFSEALKGTSLNPRREELVFGGQQKRQIYLCSYYGYCNFKGGPAVCRANGCDCNGVICL